MDLRKLICNIYYNVHKNHLCRVCYTRRFSKIPIHWVYSGGQRHALWTSPLGYSYIAGLLENNLRNVGLEQWFSPLAAHYNASKNIKKYWCLGSILRNSDLVNRARPLELSVIQMCSQDWKLLAQKSLLTESIKRGYLKLAGWIWFFFKTRHIGGHFWRLRWCEVISYMDPIAQRSIKRDR